VTNITRRGFACGIALIPALRFTSALAQSSVTPEEARAIAKEAYIYGFPMVDDYRIEHAYFVDTKSPEYKGPWNHLVNIARVYTPADTAIQSPNSDTPYSFIGLDLRAEPMVLTVPPIEKHRYFSIQFIDAYTFNFAYIGSRATGNDGGSFLVAGPAGRARHQRASRRSSAPRLSFCLPPIARSFSIRTTSTASRKYKANTGPSRYPNSSASPHQRQRPPSISSSRYPLPMRRPRPSSSTS
jgi:hypothetical protein